MARNKTETKGSEGLKPLICRTLSKRPAAGARRLCRRDRTSYMRYWGQTHCFRQMAVEGLMDGDEKEYDYQRRAVILSEAVDTR